MDDAIRFLTLMAALSSATQALTEQIKQRWPWLKTHDPDPAREARRQLAVRLLAAGTGFVLDLVSGTDPLAFAHPIWDRLNPAAGMILDSALVGFMVSYGGSFFNELLDVLRTYKQNVSPNGRPPAA